MPKLNLCLRWLNKSGIQHPNGGFYAWYNCGRKSYSFLYPEVTGYGISLFLEIYRLTNKKIFLEKAKKAARWLIGKQKKEGSFECKYFEDSNRTDGSSYIFDAGMCLYGLLNLYQFTSDSDYLEKGLKTAEWLLRSQMPDGSFLAGYDADGGIKNDASHWSTSRGCHHLKNILWLNALYKITENKRFLEAEKKLLRWGLELQLDTGRFQVSSILDETYTHAHCYATEGLIKAIEVFGENEEILSGIKKSARWLSSVQNPDGSIFNYHFSKKEKMKVVDAVAQSIRIWFITNEFILDKREFEEEISKGLKFLDSLQCLNKKKKRCGGIYYAKRDGSIVEHVNTCATFFTIQAIQFLERWKDDSCSPLDSLF